MVALPDWVLTIVTFGITIALTALAVAVTGVLIGRAMRRSSPLVGAGARRLGMTLVAVTGVLLAIQQLGVSPVVLLFVVGLLGVASLIALRGYLENFGAKYFSDVYLPFKAGDTIQVGAHVGKVIEINPMCTILLTDDDRLVSVPNQLFMREVVVNTTPLAWKELTIPLSIASSVDLPTFEAHLLKSLGKLKLRLDRRFPPVLTTKSRSPQSTDLTLTVMLGRPEDREALLHEVNSRISEALNLAQPSRRARRVAVPGPPGTAP